jgi:hypothetical protein
MFNKFVAATVVVLFLAACGSGGGGGGSGGGGGDGGATSSGTGAVGVVLTDKPAELSEIDEILISITGVELFGENDERKVTLYNGPARGPFDLLKLEDESRLLTFDDKVPVGTYCKIRLTLSDLELVFNTGEDPFHPKLPGNKKLDLNARDCFYVAPGDTVYLQLDMDAKSIHIVETKKGTSYNFRPVVFIDVINKNFPSKLIRLEEGEIRAINRDEGTLLLCNFSYGYRAKGGRDDCVTVRIKDTAAFDNIEDDGINETSGGNAIPLDELLIDGREGTRPVTVVGLFSQGDDVVHHDGDENYYPVMDGLVVELGRFLTLNGRVANDASDTRFNMELAPDQAISVDGVLPVALQPTDPPVNGTRIMNRYGDALKTSDIIVPRPVMVDGVLMLQSGGDPDYYNSALVIVHDIAIMDSDEATGIIAEEVVPGSLRLSADSFPCEEGAGTFEVTFDSGTLVYISTSTGGEWGDTGDLRLGQDVDIRGVCDGTSLAADAIIIRED